MSHVTDIILITFIDDGGIEDAHPNVDLLNEYLTQHNHGQLIKVDGYAVGHKVMQCDVFLSAANFLYIDEFVKEFNKVPWEDPDSVQLLLKDEEDDRFTVYTPPSEWESS